MIKVGIVGATGYTGEELIKILIKHPHVRLTYLAAKIDKEEPIDKIFPHFKNRLDLKCEIFDIEKAISRADLFLLALPHTVSVKIAPLFLNHKKKVIDLSADYRFQDTGVYEKWYKVKHGDKTNLKKAVYGLPELYREKIKKADFVANPGCYPTAAALGIIPSLVSGIINPDSVIIDAKSGVTGAGRKASIDFFYSEINEGVKAYKIDTHQHMPEINQVLSSVADKKVDVTFCPHLIPMNRGILETIYMKLNKKINYAKVLEIYKKFFKLEPFVRIVENDAYSTKSVAGTNFCDIGLKVNEDKGLLIVVSAIDNLLKGASGQAVQNMNIMCGFPEESGLL
ncbi:MAG: N-acetyl-gamma-glutamyl-phosphate reductase [Candidatus Omnitrophica bacterium]|nr:N-acetyl-gamma-glutamyl-phosphate reductase [Candidatus Omnitrophota bacterium]MDD5355725.1 N-acetyl-gamma-glutamyl-phosphate reductase [Candidatus Omnitrophota bacterium]